MRYVLTGANGHIGNNLVRYILEQDSNAEIVALLRKKSDISLNGLNVKIVQGDITSESFLSENIFDNDIVISMAGVIDLKNNKKEETDKINYQAVVTLVKVTEKRKNIRFILVGSVDGVYKEKGIDKIYEPTDFYPDLVLGNYGKSKARAMKFVLDKIKLDSSFNGAIAIPSAVIGVFDYKPSAVGKVVLGVINNKAEFGIKGGYNFVSVRDVAKGIYLLANSDKRDVYFISGENKTVKEMYLTLNGIAKVNHKVIIVPLFLAKLFSVFVPVLSKITLKALTDPHNYQNDKIKKDLGLNFTPIDKTFSETVNWFKENKKLFNK